MFIDTHCHFINDGVVIPDLSAVLGRAADAGVHTIVCASADPKDITVAPALAAAHDNIFCTVGIHPEYASADARTLMTNDVLSHPRVVGVGEIGLDYHYGRETRQAQIKLFETQLEIAVAAKLPVAIHTRDAEEDTMAIVGATPAIGVLHCFTGSWELARTMLDRGFYISASGIITFKNADAIRDTFARIPLNRLVIETDSPYCAPVPHRGSPCEPAFVVETARVLAAIHKIDISDLARILEQNTQRLYPKIS